MRAQTVNVIVEKDGNVLMLKRSFYPEGKLDLLGGFVEDEESIEDAARREAKEESGFDVELIKKLGAYEYFDRGEKLLHVFIGNIISGQLTSSREGTPFWMDVINLKKDDLAFPQVHVQILSDFFKEKGMRLDFSD